MQVYYLSKVSRRSFWLFAFITSHVDVSSRFDFPNLNLGKKDKHNQNQTTGKSDE